MKNTSSFLYTLFSITIFLGAFLLFQVQPLIGKYILPWFGGASFVWITSLLFFQTLLLAGYFYAYLITKLQLRAQIIIHVTLATLGIFLMIVAFKTWASPLTPDISWKLPDTIPPSLQVLHILLISVGFPYFLLSITSTLLQKWFSYTSSKKTPYALYSISNAGSLLGIASYPFFIEPSFTIHDQSFYWSIIFILYTAILILSAVLIAKNNNKKLTEAKDKQTNVNQSTKPNKSALLAWFSLPAISSMMLLSGTNQLTQFVAPIPLIWLLPLGLYLVSFILTFDDKHRYVGRLYAYIFFILLPFLLIILLTNLIPGIIAELFLYTGILFCSFMFCHGELYRLRPSSNHLNMFYLQISFGSVVGAGIVAIIAPLFFKGLSWEFLLGLYACTIIATFVLVNDNNSFLVRLHFLPKKKLALFFIIIFSIFFSTTAVLNFALQAQSSVGIWRNFYGILRITDDQTNLGTLRCIAHGKIVHGCQFENASLHNKPMKYFGNKSGIGLTMKSLHDNDPKSSLRIGIIGLGAGNLAAYGRKSDYITFYELNPLNIELTEKYFSYITDSPSKITIVAGDGRLSLERELKEKKKGNFDILIMDAFNDDAIPPHLLTREAFAVYKQHLASPKSIIAVNISTSYLNLNPLMIQLSNAFSMHLVIVEGHSDGALNSDSRWAIFSEDKKLLDIKELKKAKLDVSDEPQIPVWTDQYSNLFHLLQ